MFEHYLEMGGNEVLNSARSLGYTRTADCPVSWLRCPPCDGVVDALGDDPYIYQNIADAPWYDAEDPRTARFLGASAITIEGISDSTREADVAEAITDGGVVGRVRHATRRVRVRALLTAQGEDALEAGLGWLKSALDPDECGQHGSSCGSVDACFFEACPPEPTEFTEQIITEQESRRNYFPDPRATALTRFSATPATVTLSSVAWFGEGDSDTAIHAERTATGNVRLLDFIVGPDMPHAGETLTLRFRVWSSFAFALAVSARQAVATSTGTLIVNWGSVNLVPGEQIVEISGPATALATTATSGITLSTTSAGAGNAIEVTDIQLEVRGVVVWTDTGRRNEAFVRGSNYGTTTGAVARTIDGADAVYTYSGTPNPAWSDALRVQPLQIGNTAGDRTPVTPGDVWRGKFSVGANRLRGMHWLIQFYDAAGASVGSTSSPDAQPEADGTPKASADFYWTIPMGAASMNAILISGPASSPVGFVAGDTVTLRDVFVEKGATPTYSDWTTVRRNVCYNPYFANGLANWTSFFAPARALDTAEKVTGTQSQRLNKGSGDGRQGTFPNVVGGTAGVPLNGASHCVARVKAPVGMPYQFSLVYGTGTGGTNPTQMIGTGDWQIVTYDFATPAATPGNIRPLVIVTNSAAAAVGDILFWVDQMSVEYNTTGPIFDAVNHDPVNNALTQYVWEGAANTTASLMQTRALMSAVQPLGTPFDGGTTATDTRRYLWTGTPDASASYEQSSNGAGALGPYFDGNTPDTDFTIYDWVSTPNDSASIALMVSTTTVLDPEAYQIAVEKLDRRMHNVTCVSGPTIEQKLHRDNTYGYIVEFILVAATPWIFGLTRPVDLSPSLPVVVQDIPFNLVPYPSAELASGTVGIATNMTTNPSLEVDASGWIATATPYASEPAVAAYFTSGRVTGELAAAGVASMRARILGNLATTVADAQAQIIIQNTTALPAAQPGLRCSFTIWGATAILAGGAVTRVDGMKAQAQFYNGAALLSTVDLGTALPTEFNGRVFAAKSSLIPAGATQVLTQVIFDVTWGSSATAANNSDLRMYADAMAVTVP